MNEIFAFDYDKNYRKICEAVGLGYLESKSGNIDIITDDEYPDLLQFEHKELLKEFLEENYNVVFEQIDKETGKPFTKEQEIASFIERHDPKHFFGPREKEQINEGFLIGLTAEQVSVYADSEMKWSEMLECKLGLENGLTTEQVKIYNNRKYSFNQMGQIRLGFEKGLSMEQVQLYANEKYSADAMCQIRDGFLDGLSIEQVKTFAHRRFNESQMIQARNGFKDGLSIEEVKSYMNPNISFEEMQSKRQSLVDNKENKLSLKELKKKAEQIVNKKKAINKENHYIEKNIGR